MSTPGMADLAKAAQEAAKVPTRMEAIAKTAASLELATRHLRALDLQAAMAHIAVAGIWLDIAKGPR